MTRQDQININKKKPAPAGNDDDASNQDLTAELPDIVGILEYSKDVLKMGKRKVFNEDCQCYGWVD